MLIIVGFVLLAMAVWQPPVPHSVLIVMAAAGMVFILVGTKGGPRRGK